MEKIIKIQIDVMGTNMFCYNEDRTVSYEAYPEPEIKERVGGPMGKKYFYYTIKNGIVELGEEAEEQTW